MIFFLLVTIANAQCDSSVLTNPSNCLGKTGILALIIIGIVIVCVILCMCMCHSGFRKIGIRGMKMCLCAPCIFCSFLTRKDANYESHKGRIAIILLIIFSVCTCVMTNVSMAYVNVYGNDLWNNFVDAFTASAQPLLYGPPHEYLQPIANRSNFTWISDTDAYALSNLTLSSSINSTYMTTVLILFQIVVAFFSIIPCCVLCPFTVFAKERGSERSRRVCNNYIIFMVVLYIALLSCALIILLVPVIYPDQILPGCVDTDIIDNVEFNTSTIENSGTAINETNVFIAIGDFTPASLASTENYSVAIAEIASVRTENGATMQTCAALCLEPAMTAAKDILWEGDALTTFNDFVNNYTYLLPCSNMQLLAVPDDSSSYLVSLIMLAIGLFFDILIFLVLSVLIQKKSQIFFK